MTLREQANAHTEMVFEDSDEGRKATEEAIDEFLEWLLVNADAIAKAMWEEEGNIDTEAFRIRRMVAVLLGEACGD